MQFEDIIYEKKEHVAWITINRPERYNAFDHKTLAELRSAFEAAGLDGKIGVVVLTGAGEAFSAGVMEGEEQGPGAQADLAGLLGQPRQHRQQGWAVASYQKWCSVSQKLS